jgi:hypothetical protein
VSPTNAKSEWRRAPTCPRHATKSITRTEGNERFNETLPSRAPQIAVSTDDGGQSYKGLTCRPATQDRKIGVLVVCCNAADELIRGDVE